MEAFHVFDSSSLDSRSSIISMFTCSHLFYYSGITFAFTKFSQMSSFEPFSFLNYAAECYWHVLASWNILVYCFHIYMEWMMLNMNSLLSSFHASNSPFRVVSDYFPCSPSLWHYITFFLFLYRTMSTMARKGQNLEWGFVECKRSWMLSVTDTKKPWMSWIWWTGTSRKLRWTWRKG